ALKQIQDTPANPRELENAIPDHIARTILRCLEKDPAKRFQSVEELEAALLDESPSQKNASTIRKDTPWMAAVLTAAAAILFLVAAATLNSGAETQRVAASPSDAEFAAFHMADSLDTQDSWNVFLAAHQQGRLVSAARERLRKSEERAQRVSNVVVST